MSKIVGVTVGTPLSLNRIKREIEPAIEEHEKNKENPHGVTATQIGLGNVDNISDMDKPVSTAQAEAIAEAKKAGTDAQSAADNAQIAAENAQTTVDNHIADQNNPHGVTTAQIGAQAQHQNKVITLSASKWSGFSQTVSVAGLGKDDTVISTPSAESHDLYAEYGVMLYSQAAGTLTYVCKEVPAENLTVDVTYFPVGGTGVAGGGSSGSTGGSTSSGSTGGNFVQVQSDWNQTDETAADFIKNKPFGDELVEIIPLNDMTFAYDEEFGGIIATVTVDAPPNDGDILNISFEGTAYSCQVANYGNMLGFGNAAFMGMDDTDEPFFGAFFDTTLVLMDLTAQEDVVRSISIYKLSKTKLPSAYLPGAVTIFYFSQVNEYIYSDIDYETKVTRAELKKAITNGIVCLYNPIGAQYIPYKTYVLDYGVCEILKCEMGGSVTQIRYFTAEYEG